LAQIKWEPKNFNGQIFWVAQNYRMVIEIGLITTKLVETVGD
jgi:hypothetical protein